KDSLTEQASKGASVAVDYTKQKGSEAYNVASEKLQQGKEAAIDTGRSTLGYTADKAAQVKGFNKEKVGEYTGAAKEKTQETTQASAETANNMKDKT
ncbi:hypothetical protein QHH03_31055, partial [Aphanizomenon sp. 202]|nr:hypothetical protein [Aphanizomenon sp. 202]